MRVTIAHEYRVSGRRPAIWVAAALFVCVAGLMALQGSAFVNWLPLVLGGGTILWLLIRNPVYGLRVEQDRVVL